MKKFVKMTYPYLIWAGIMIVIPMLMILMYSITTSGNEVVTLKFTLDNFINFFKEPIYVKVLLLSFKIAIYTTICCIILGYPAAYFMAQLKNKSRNLMMLLITLPMWINMLVRTYAWMGMLQNDGLFNKILGYLGIGPVKMIGTEWAVVLVMVYNFLPFMILQIYSSLSKMDKSYLEAASDLGANRLQSFLRVTLPLSLPGVISGITLVFLPAASTFQISQLIGQGSMTMIGNVIESMFLKQGKWNEGSAISLIMAIIIMFSMYLTKKVDKDPSSNGRGRI